MATISTCFKSEAATARPSHSRWKCCRILLELRYLKKINIKKQKAWIPVSECIYCVVCILQVNYILGDNPVKMSYLVGFGDTYPEHVHHRAASIPWDGHKYSCSEGRTRWRDRKEPNPNLLVGAMVAGPDHDEGFLDIRNRHEYTEPSISGNAGLVAALIALIDNQAPSTGMDRDKIFAHISKF